ncbi:hypothetical protein N0V94_003587 [Neodidymelliopsis sp. IMI 364377]|nr:hypothetical protein N0V94_003587 [Neodidymelliopsis sp. IMI 364377]
MHDDPVSGQLRLNPEGDEYILGIDTAGEQKITQSGRLLGSREFRCRSFFLPRRGPKLFMLATDCARVLEWRDSYLMFNMNKTLYKIIATEEEKDHLIHQKILPYSYRSRQVAVVTARPMFKQFGSRLIVNGKKMVDDYWEDKARQAEMREQRRTPHHAIPELQRPEVPRPYSGTIGAPKNPYAKSIELPVPRNEKPRDAEQSGDQTPPLQMLASNSYNVDDIFVPSLYHQHTDNAFYPSGPLQEYLVAWKIQTSCGLCKSQDIHPPPKQKNGQLVDTILGRDIKIMPTVLIGSRAIQWNSIMHKAQVPPEERLVLK